MRGGLFPLIALTPAKSRGVGSGRWCSQLRCQEGSGSSHRKETKETIKELSCSTTPSVVTMAGGKRKTRRRLRQKGVAVFRRKKPRMVDEITEGMSMFFVRSSPLVRSCGNQIGFPSRQGDQRQRATLSTTNWTWHLGYTGKCWQDRLQTRQGQEV